MKYFAFLTLIIGTAFSVPAATDSWRDLSTNLFNNVPIVWHFPTNQLPEKMWVYQRTLPHVFPSTILSNAVVLGSLQKRGFPKPSTNEFFIWMEVPPNYPGPIPSVLEIRPNDAEISFSVPKASPVSNKELPNNESVLKWGKAYAAQFGVDSTGLAPGRIYNSGSGRGVFFSRRLDQTLFFTAADNGSTGEGFSIEFGKQERIVAFYAKWSDLERYCNQRTASLDEISRCIRAHEAIVMPNWQPDDFDRLRALATAKKFTFTKITPYYQESFFAEDDNFDTPCKYAVPFAEIDGVADFGTSNAPVQLLVPILSSEISRLMKQ